MCIKADVSGDIPPTTIVKKNFICEKIGSKSSGRRRRTLIPSQPTTRPTRRLLPIFCWTIRIPPKANDNGVKPPRRSYRTFPRGRAWARRARRSPDRPFKCLRVELDPSRNPTKTMSCAGVVEGASLVVVVWLFALFGSVFCVGVLMD